MEQAPIEALRPSPHLPAAAKGRVSAQARRLVQEFHILEPILVRKITGFPRPFYEILDGYQQWVIAGELGYDKVPILDSGFTEEESQRYLQEKARAMHENPIATAKIWQSKLQQNPHLRKTDFAYLEGLTLESLSHGLRLLKLSPVVQARIEQGMLSAGQGRRLVGLTEAQQQQLADAILQEKLSCREIESRVRKYRQGKEMKALLNAPSSTAIPPVKDVNVLRLENQLSEQLGCPVTLVEGKMVINYFSDNEILENLLEHIR